MMISERLDRIAARVVAVANSSAGRKLTRNQGDEVSSALAELSALRPDVARLAGDDPTLAALVERLAERSRHGTPSVSFVGDSLTEIAERSRIAERSDELDATRGLMSQAIAHAPESRNRMDTSTSSLRSLWSTWRAQGFAATDSYLSPTFEARALQSAGGSAIPSTFADFVTVYERTTTPMLDPNIVRVIPSKSGAPLILPRLTADPNHGGTVTAEAAAINELDPTISSVTLDAYKYSVINLFSAELDQDDAVNIDDLLADSTGRELGIDIGAHLTTGDGSAKPRGFLDNATNGGTASGTANSTFFGWTDLMTLWGSVAAGYRTQGTFMVSPTAYVKILSLQDANGQPVLGLNNGSPTLLGRPIVENPAMAAVASASKSVAFGDFSRYVVRRVQPTRIELSRDYKFSTDQVALKVVERVDGELIDAAAIAYLVSANA